MLILVVYLHLEQVYAVVKLVNHVNLQ